MQKRSPRICIARCGPALIGIIVTVIVSLATKPKPDAELKGLVYGRYRHSERGRRQPAHRAPDLLGRSGAGDFSRAAVDFLVSHIWTNITIIPVWFFVGLLLGIYGVLIFASGIAEWSIPGQRCWPNCTRPCGGAGF